MSKKRFIVVVLDSFGIGAMDDVAKVRPNDIGSNTCLHLLEYPHTKFWPHLQELGLMNALNQDVVGFAKSSNAIFGRSELKHFGADSYFGHRKYPVQILKNHCSHISKFIWMTSRKT
ncbi:hypothetical protein MGH68_04355 [Erysipelothrix sp. D19-032]